MRVKPRVEIPLRISAPGNNRNLGVIDGGWKSSYFFDAPAPDTSDRPGFARASGNYMVASFRSAIRFLGNIHFGFHSPRAFDVGGGPF